MSEEDQKKPIDLSKSRFDQSKWFGRVRHFVNVTSPVDVDGATDLIDRHMRGEHVNATDEQLWNAKRLVEATVHPDTGEMIPAPFRMSAFAPVNVLLCWGMLLPASNVLVPVFWQWLNQSYNVALNHCNRNASNFMSNTQIATAYTGAVASSCGLSFILPKILRASPPRIKLLVTPFIPYTAVASAGIVNVLLMRGNEMVEGVTVKRKSDGAVVGKSPKAGQAAVTKAAISRAVWSIPALVIPPIVLNGYLLRQKWFTSRPRLHGPAKLALIAGSLVTGVPAAIALYPQMSEIPTSKLESQFHNLKDVDGSPLDSVVYNRGL